jgi:hypothetical protein
MGEGQKRVRSCSFVMKRDGAERAVKVRCDGGEISGSFMGILLNRYSRREQLDYGK